MRVHLISVAILLCVSTAARAAPPTWPRAQEVWLEGFDEAALPDAWEDQGGGRIRLTAEAAAPPTARGVAVDVSGEDQTYLQLYNLTPWPHREFPRDTYLRIAVNPNGVTIPAGEAVSLIRMRDADWNVMAGVRLRQVGTAYEVVLELPDGSLDAVALPLEEGWHEVMLGCRPHDWLGLWVDDGAPQVVTGVSHTADVVGVVLLGKADGFWNGTTPSGTLYLDEATLFFAAWDALWVDAVTGDDTSEGDTGAAPLRTLGLAALLSAPGTTVHVAPGDYRESVVLPVDGTEAQPLRFVADGGRGTARLLGSNPATDLAWTRLTDAGEIDLPAGVDLGTATIWKADLSAWALTTASTLAIDTGGPLPASLLALLAKFGIDPGQKGAALDRGALEHDPAAPDDPFTLDVGPSSGVSDATPPWDVHYPDPDAGPGGGGDGDGTGCGCQAASGRDGPALLLLGLIAGLIRLRRCRRPRR